MASGVYNQFKTEIMRGSIDLVNDTIKCALLNTSHSFAASALGWATPDANEISGTGYSANGETLTVTVSQDDSDNEGVFDAADVEWTGATFSAYHAVIYDFSVSSPLKPLICSIDFGGEQQVTSGTFTIQWAAEGIVNIT